MSFEFRGKRDSARWRAGWDRALAVGGLAMCLAHGATFLSLKTAGRWPAAAAGLPCGCPLRRGR